MHKHTRARAPATHTTPNRLKATRSFKCNLKMVGGHWWYQHPACSGTVLCNKALLWRRIVRPLSWSWGKTLQGSNPDSSEAKSQGHRMAPRACCQCNNDGGVLTVHKTYLCHRMLDSAHGGRGRMSGHRRGIFTWGLHQPGLMDTQPCQAGLASECLFRQPLEPYAMELIPGDQRESPDWVAPA